MEDLEISELFPLKNAYFLCHFSQAILEGQQLDVHSLSKKKKKKFTQSYTQQVIKEKSLFTLLSHLGLRQFDFVLSEIKDNEPLVCFMALRLYAQLLKTQDSLNKIQFSSESEDAENKEEEIAKLSKQKQEIVEQAQKLLADFDWTEITEEAEEEEKPEPKKDKKSKKKSEEDEEDENEDSFFSSKKDTTKQTAAPVEDTSKQTTFASQFCSYDFSRLISVVCLIYGHEKQFGQIVGLVTFLQKNKPLSKKVLLLEHLHFKVLACLSINRFDLAQKALSAMSEKNDEATLTLMTSIYVLLSKPQEREEAVAEAEQQLNQLSNKYHGGNNQTSTSSSKQTNSFFLNAKAIIEIRKRKDKANFADAEVSCSKALATNPQDVDTQVNLFVCRLLADPLQNSKKDDESKSDEKKPKKKDEDDEEEEKDEEEDNEEEEEIDDIFVTKKMKKESIDRMGKMDCFQNSWLQLFRNKEEEFDSLCKMFGKQDI